MGQGAEIQVCANPARRSRGRDGPSRLERGQWGVGEHRVVSVVGEQLTLPVRDGLGVQPLDPAHDQPAADVVALAAGGERGKGYLGDFGVREQAFFVFVPDRVRVVERDPRRLTDARDRCGDSGFILAVIENRAPLLRAAAMTSWVYELSARTVINAPPQASVVTNASDTSFAASSGRVGPSPTQPGPGDHRHGTSGLRRWRATDSGS